MICSAEHTDITRASSTKWFGESFEQLLKINKKINQINILKKRRK